MPQTSAMVANGDTVRASDHNSLVTDVSGLFSSDSSQGLEILSIKLPPSATATYTGRKLTAVTTAEDKFVVNWNKLKITSIVYQKPVGTTVATYTAVYTGRAITGWTKS